MAKSLITLTLGGPSHGVLGLIAISDKIARLSEAEYAFETKRRKLEHQFEVTNSELREEYLAAVRSRRPRGERTPTCSPLVSSFASRCFIWKNSNVLAGAASRGAWWMDGAVR